MKRERLLLIALVLVMLYMAQGFVTNLIAQSHESDIAVMREQIRILTLRLDQWDSRYDRLSLGVFATLGGLAFKIVLDYQARKKED